MKINGNAIRIGNVIEHKGQLWRAMKLEQVKPGKGGAFAQIELRDIRNGTKLNERFRADEKVERVTLEQKPYAYLYDEGDYFVFMDNETYEQIQVEKDAIGEPARFLQEGMVCEIELYEEEVIGASLPEHVVMELVEADAVVKGQTASSSYKPAVLENGVRILVPPHLGAGTRVKVNTQDGSYVERAKD